MRDYLDTGLFLDHRNTRNLATKNVEGKSVLNLFAYTGSFSVYAAARGAVEVVTVDLSKTYLAWAEENFALNQLNAKQHAFIKADVIDWVNEARKELKRFDTIIVDPPTFSNSKSMNDSFEVERDQRQLLLSCGRLLAKNGSIWLSTNKRRFKLAPQILEKFNVIDQTDVTHPDDFRRRPHQCWCLTKKESAS